MKTNPKTELTMVRMENGKYFIEVDAAVKWCEESAELAQQEGDGQESRKLAYGYMFTAYVLKGMQKRGVEGPAGVMTEQEYYDRN